MTDSIFAAYVLSFYGVLGMLFAPILMKLITNHLREKELVSRGFINVLTFVGLIAVVATDFFFYSEIRPCTTITGALAEVTTIISSATVGTALFEVMWLVAFAVIHIYNKCKEHHRYYKKCSVYFK